jgi:hypothetical protein
LILCTFNFDGLIWRNIPPFPNKITGCDGAYHIYNVYVSFAAQAEIPCGLPDSDTPPVFIIADTFGWMKEYTVEPGEQMLKVIRKLWREAFYC